MDCPDLSDEAPANPTCGPCDPGDFFCLDGACIDPAAWGGVECNGNPQCIDNSDEAPINLTCGGCGLDFECGDGSCIPAPAVCDGFPDCLDNSDEDPVFCGGGCGPDFQCGDGSCIPAPAVCDGVPDCLDNSDEDPGICGVCGDGLVDPGEECDPGAPLDPSCEAAGLTGIGPVGCDGFCSIDLSQCNPPTGYANCAQYPEASVCTPEEVCATDDMGDFVCLELGCASTADCAPDPASGNAPVTCADLSGDMIGDCYLSCQMGETCPDGMICALGTICAWVQ